MRRWAPERHDQFRHPKGAGALLVVLGLAACSSSLDDLQVSAVEPAEVTQGQWATVVIRGRGFGALSVDLQSPAKRALRASLGVRIGDRELASSSVVLLGPGEAQASFFADLAPGRHDLSVTTGAGSWVVLPAAISVVDAASSIGQGGSQDAAASVGTEPAMGGAGGADNVATDAAGGGGQPGAGSGALLPVDAGLPASSPVDAALGASGGASVAAAPCSPPIANAGSSALFTFEGNAADQFGHATVLTTPEEYTSSGEGCGLAVVLSGGRHLTLTDSTDLPTAAGSLEFHMNASTPVGAAQALISRDSDLQLSGLMTLYQTGEGDGRLVLRVSGAADTFLCSDRPIPPDTWTRVGINFGLPGWELYVDGARQTASDTVSLDGLAVTCGGVTTTSLSSFQLDWTLGATARGTAWPTTLRAFATGNFDNFHLSAARLGP